MATLRRNLRNSNTCPLAQNPLKSADTQNPFSLLIPPHIANFIANSNTLTCSQIISLPIFNFTCQPSEAFAQIQKAARWQCHQIGQLVGTQLSFNQNSSVKVHKQMKITQKMAQEQVRQEKHEENELYLDGVLLDNQIRDYMKNPFDLRQFNKDHGG